MDKSNDSPADIPPASSEDESLLMGLAGLEVDALHAGKLERDAAPPRRAAIPLAGPAQDQAGTEVAAPGAAAPAAPAAMPAVQAPPVPAAKGEDTSPAVARPPDRTGDAGQYRSDRPRRGADFAWPKEVLELVQSTAAATIERPALPPADSALPSQGSPAEAARPTSLPQAPALSRAVLPRRRRRTAKPPVRHDIDLLIQLACIAAGAWVSVLLARLLL